MPVYNGEKFIREALDSLLAQTFTDFELIISDNASTDGTESICREYAEKDARIRYVRQIENKGAIANFKFVLDEAKAEYFMWAAHDDMWGENFIKNNREYLKVNSHCVGSISKSRIENDDMPRSVGYYPIIGKSFNDRIFDFISNPGSNARFYALYHANILKKIRISDFFYIGGDWGVIVEILKNGCICLSGNEVNFFKRKGISSDPVKMFDSFRTDSTELFFPLWKLSKYLIKETGNISKLKMFIILLRRNLSYSRQYWILKIKYFVRRKIL